MCYCRCSLFFAILFRKLPFDFLGVVRIVMTVVVVLVVCLCLPKLIPWLCFATVPY